MCNARSVNVFGRGQQTWQMAHSNYTDVNFYGSNNIPKCEHRLYELNVKRLDTNIDPIYMAIMPIKLTPIRRQIRDREL